MEGQIHEILDEENCCLCRMCCACVVFENDHGDSASRDRKGDAESYMDTELQAIRELNGLPKSI